MPAVQIVGECECVADAVEAIGSSQIDLALLDVQLPDGTGSTLSARSDLGTCPPSCSSRRMTG